MRHIIFLFIGLLIIGGLSSRPAAAAPPTKEIVQDAVKNYIAHAPKDVSMMTIGSWVGNNKRYKDPLNFGVNGSDHDMTLITPAGSGPQEMLDEWKRARQDISEYIRRKMGADGRSAAEIDRVIESISIYPPQPLIDSALPAGATKEEVKKFFETVDHGHKLTPNLANQETEGLFGPGSKAYRQHYESTAGRAVYKDGNKVRTGIVDLQHMKEGYGLFKLEGAANLSDQFSTKILEAIREGKGKDAGKNLGRLRMYLKKTKDLGRVKTRSRTDRILAELQERFATVEAQAKRLPVTSEGAINKLYQEWLERNGRALEEAVSTVKMELGLYKQLAKTTNPEEVKLIYQILERKSSVWQRFFEKMRKQNLAKIPWRPIIKGFNAIIFTIETKGVLDVYRRDGLKAALNHAAIRTVILSMNIPQSLAYMIAETAFDLTKQGMYGVVTQFQSCEQLLAGISQMPGHVKVGEGTDTDQLAHEIIYKDELKIILEKQVDMAVGRKFTSSTEEEIKAGLKQKLMHRCLPWVVKIWEHKRMEMLGNVLSAKKAVDSLMTNAILSLNDRVVPEKNGKSRVAVSVSFNHGRRALLDALQRLQDSIQEMGGSKRLGMLMVSERLQWNVDGGATPVVLRDLDVSGSGSVLLDPKVVKTFLFDQASGHRIELVYRLNISPGLMVAYDLIHAKNLLTESYKYKAGIVLDRQFILTVEGPRHAAVGQTVTLHANVKGINHNLSEKPALKIQWLEGEKELARGADFNWHPPAVAGRYKLRAILVRNGERVAESAFVLRVYPAVSLDFHPMDAEKGTPISGATMTLEGVSRTYTQNGSGGTLHFGNIQPGIYTYVVSAPGYKDFRGQKTFKRKGSYTVRMSRGKSSPVADRDIIEHETGEKRKLVRLKLSRDDIIMGLNRKIVLSATALISQGPVLIPKNVTADVKWSTDDPDIILQPRQGIVASGNREGTTQVHARYTTPQGETLDASCRVKVRNLSAKVPVVDFDVSPHKAAFQTGELVTFTRKIGTGNAAGYYFIWLLDGREKRGPAITHIFTKPGNYSVRLVVKSIATGKEDALAKTISVVSSN